VSAGVGGMNSASRQSAESSGQQAVSGLHEPSARDGELLASYREMANDREHQVEALEWCEG